MFTQIFNFILFVLRNVYSEVLTFINPFLEPVVDALPVLDYDLSFLSPIIGLANRFIDLQYGLLLFSSYLVLCLTLSLVNWILGLIPTIN